MSIQNFQEFPQTENSSIVPSPRFVRVKKEPIEEEISQYTGVENFIPQSEDVHADNNDMGETGDVEELKEPLFVAIKTEPGFEVEEEKLEATDPAENYTTKMIRFPGGKCSVNKTYKMENFTMYSDHRVRINSDGSNKEKRRLLQRSSNPSAKCLMESGRKSATPYTCVDGDVRGDGSEQNGGLLDVGRKRCSIVGESCIMVQEKGKTNEKKGQSSSSRGTTPGKSEGHKKRNKPFSCDSCGTRFTRRSHLKVHEMRHTGERPFQCVLCNKAFKTKGELEMHMRVHTDDRPYKCSTCKKSFKNISNLKKHIRVHSGEKPFTCRECGKTFTESGSLKNHVRLHTGEKPYKCNGCGKSFSQSTNLNTHMRVHTGERPFACEICGLRFTQSGHLHRHWRVVHGFTPLLT